ncbi:MAG: hypothetical protein AB8B72_00265 [Crocinitomicaceae bacterium]
MAIDTIEIHQRADSILALHGITIPAPLLRKTKITEIKELRTLYFSVRNSFVNEKVKLDSNNYKYYGISHFFNDNYFQIHHFSFVMATNNTTGETTMYYPKSNFLFLKSMKSPTCTFKKLTIPTITSLLQYNNEVKVLAYKQGDQSYGFFSCRDSLVGKSQFTIQPKVMYADTWKDEKYVTSNQLINYDSINLNLKYMPVLFCEGGEQVIDTKNDIGHCFFIGKNGNILIRTHQIIININSFRVIYDGYPSTRSHIYRDRF